MKKLFVNGVEIPESAMQSAMEQMLNFYAMQGVPPDGKTVFGNKLLKSCVIKIAEPIKSLNLGRNIVFSLKSLVCIKSSLSGLNGVDNVLLNSGEISFSYISGEDIYFS